MYWRWKRLAEQTGDPARLAKCNAIQVQAKSRIATAVAQLTVPTNAQLAAGARIPKLALVFDIGMYGRNRCREMVNRPLSFVVNYNPSTDPNWPS